MTSQTLQDKAMILPLIIFAIIFSLGVVLIAEPLAEWWATHDTREPKRYRIEMRNTPDWLYSFLRFCQYGIDEWIDAVNKKLMRK